MPYTIRFSNFPGIRVPNDLGSADNMSRKESLSHYPHLFGTAVSTVELIPLELRRTVSPHERIESHLIAFIKVSTVVIFVNCLNVMRAIRSSCKCLTVLLLLLPIGSCMYIESIQNLHMCIFLNYSALIKGKPKVSKFLLITGLITSFTYVMQVQIFRKQLGTVFNHLS